MLADSNEPAGNPRISGQYPVAYQYRPSKTKCLRGNVPPPPIVPSVFNWSWLHHGDRGSFLVQNPRLATFGCNMTDSRGKVGNMDRGCSRTLTALVPAIRRRDHAVRVSTAILEMTSKSPERSGRGIARHVIAPAFLGSLLGFGTLARAGKGLNLWRSS